MFRSTVEIDDVGVSWSKCCSVSAGKKLCSKFEVGKRLIGDAKVDAPAPLAAR